MQDRKGLVLPTLIASISLIIGAWTRVFVGKGGDRFWVLILGQTISGLGQPFVYAAPAKLSAIWFGDKERAKATTIGALALPLGAIVGFVLPAIFVRVPETLKEGFDATEPDIIDFRE